MKKHSLTIAGHPTSISLEDEFWDELKLLAKAQGISISKLIETIDAQRDPEGNLCSALRLYILMELKKSAAD